MIFPESAFFAPLLKALDNLTANELADSAQVTICCRGYMPWHEPFFHEPKTHLVDEPKHIDLPSTTKIVGQNPETGWDIL